MSSAGAPNLYLIESGEETAIEHSAFLSVLANRNRMHILFLLSDRERSVGELMRELDETPVVVSRHLTILRENNIICGRRDGRGVRYSLKCHRALQMVQAMVGIFPDDEEGGEGD